MHRRPSTLVFPVLLSLALVGCASLRPLKVQPEPLGQVRTVAIVGYDAYLSEEVKAQVSPSVWQDLMLRSLAGQGTPAAAAVASTAQSLLGGTSAPCDRLAARLESALGWSVLPREKLAADPVYARLLVEHRHAPSLGAMGVPNLMSGSAARSLSSGERAELMRSLGVDALVTAQVSIWSDYGDPALIATGAPLWARLDFAVLTADPQPLWTDSAHGEPSATRLPSPISLDSIHVFAAALDEATERAFDILLAHQREACAGSPCAPAPPASPAPVPAPPAPAP
jgi:hypothetical protein